MESQGEKSERRILHGSQQCTVRAQNALRKKTGSVPVDADRGQVGKGLVCHDKVT